MEAKDLVLTRHRAFEKLMALIRSKVTRKGDQDKR